MNKTREREKLVTYISRRRSVYRMTIGFTDPYHSASSNTSILGRRVIYFWQQVNLCALRLCFLWSKRKTIFVECFFFFFLRKKKWWREIPKLGWRAVAITINTVRASFAGYHDGYSRDGHRSQCLSVYSIEIIKYHREIEKERFAARSSIYLFLDSIRYSFSIGPSDFSRRPARWIGPLTEQQTQKLMVRNLGYCLMMLCIGEEEEEEKEMGERRGQCSMQPKRGSFFY